MKRTHSCTAHSPTHSRSIRGYTCPRSHAFLRSLSVTFFLLLFFAKRQLQARRPCRCLEGSSRERVATASCWEHIWRLVERPEGEAAPFPSLLRVRQYPAALRLSEIGSSASVSLTVCLQSEGTLHT